MRNLDLHDSRTGNPVRTLLRTDIVAVGEFRCAPEHPQFRTAGQMRRHCFVFPRRAVRIAPDAARPFIGDPSHVALYNPARPYERSAVHPDGDLSDWVTIAPQLAREIVQSLDPTARDRSDNALIRWSQVPVDGRTYLRHRVFHRYLRTEANPDLIAVEETALTLFWTVCRRALSVSSRRPTAEPAPSRRSADLAEDARRYLNEHFATNDGLVRMAAALECSVFHLCRAFKRHVGMTIHQYLAEVRMRRALEALEDADADLLSLAMESGYSGHSHFTAVFRRHFGLPPSEARAVVSNPMRADGFRRGRGPGAHVLVRS